MRKRTCIGLAPAPGFDLKCAAFRLTFNAFDFEESIKSSGGSGFDGFGNGHGFVLALGFNLSEKEIRKAQDCEEEDEVDGHFHDDKIVCAPLAIRCGRNRSPIEGKQFHRRRLAKEAMRKN